jgi:hypothetical protein
MAATEQQFDGIGFMSFNNFGFSRTIAMAKEFADTIGRAAEGGRDFSFANSDNTRAILDTVFSFAEQAVATIGIDFTPTPSETERLIQIKYDSDRQRKTRLFTFDEDTLESTPEFIEACEGQGPDVSGLPGTHLTPVYFKIGLDEVPLDAREAAREAMNGIESISFGNEDELNALVNEICGWILGKQPSRRPSWQRERPLADH